MRSLFSLASVVMLACTDHGRSPNVNLIVGLGPDGESVTWTLRLSDRDFSTLVSQSRGAAMNDLVHSKLHILIATGLSSYGLPSCDPDKYVVAAMESGDVQIAGKCPLSSDGNRNVKL